MAPKRNTRKRARDQKFVAISVEAEVPLSTLTENNAVIADIFSGVLTEDLYMISADLTWELEGTLTALEGPIGFGLAHGDFSANEIEAYINLAITGPFDKVQNELNSRGRYIRRVGRFGKLDVSANQSQFNNGLPKRTSLKWINESGQNLSMWVENQGAGATTGRVVSITGTIYGRWLY